MAIRNTLQRKLVYETLARLARHATANEIFTLISREHPSISRATVYRNLNVLADEKRIRRVAVPNAACRFDARVGAHQHAHCEQCGRIYDLDLPSLDSSIQAVAQSIGFSISNVQIMLHGLCAHCRMKLSNPPNSAAKQ